MRYRIKTEQGFTEVEGYDIRVVGRRRIAVNVHDSTTTVDIYFTADILEIKDDHARPIYM